MDIVEKARVFATAAHTSIGQLRKYTGEPYIEHPKAVVEIVKGVPHTPGMLAAAWLHDTVEDTCITLEMIQLEFGDNIAAMVSMLTDVSQDSDGPRWVRKNKDRDHIAQASPEAQTIKLADLIDNSGSICARDPNFAKTYIREKAQLLEVLQKGDPALWAWASEIVRAYSQAHYII